MAPSQFVTYAANELRDLLDHPNRIATHFDPAGTAVLAFLRAHKIANGRTNLRLEEPADRALLAQLLNHPHACACVVDDAGRQIVRDKRRLA